MAAAPDVKKHLEAIVGQSLSEDDLARIKLFQDVATSAITGDGSVTTRSLLIARPNQCRQERLLDVSGIATTGQDGKSRFLLTAFLCPTGQKFGLPINIVATPLSASPLYLTVARSLVDNGADVEIQVSTWNPDGTAAPSVSFDWRCRVVLPNPFF